MDLSTPHMVALTQSEGSALAVLSRVTVPLSGREIARLSGAPRTTIANALKRLVSHGLVLVQEFGAGSSLLYSLNRQHLAAEPILTLLGLRQVLLSRISETIAEWPIAPFQASMFGSAARGDGDTSSDIDLLFVRPADTEAESPEWRESINDLAEQVLQWTGNHASITELDMTDIWRLRAERPAIVAELERDAITLIGPDLKPLFSEVELV